MEQTPQTAREIIFSLPGRLKRDKVSGELETTFHFDLNGETGGQYTVNLNGTECTVSDGLTGVPNCVVSADASVYEDVELGRANPTMAFMEGKVRVSDIGEMMKFMGLFATIA